MEQVRTPRLRIKDKHAKAMLVTARDVKSTCNFCNETQYCNLRRYTNKPRHWLSGYDLHKLTNGFSKCEGVCVGPTTQQAVCEEGATRRKQCKKHKLRWRVNNRQSAQYSLDWVPFKARALTLRNGQVRFQGIHLGLWDSHGLSVFTLGAGSFCGDARGGWYRNARVSHEAQEKRVPHGATSIGIDPGRRTMATCSDGSAFTMLRWYRLSGQALGIAQRANKKRRVRALHARIGNQRQDALHKKTTVLVKQPAAMFVSNVNATALARTGMAQSGPDASWSTSMTQRRYNAMGQCGVLSEVNEALSTRTCTGCGTLSHARWNGIAGPGIRAWTCSNGGALHDRAIHAAWNILRLGHQPLEAGVPAL